jgi:multidrug efflux system outer membrane protein
MMNPVLRMRRSTASALLLLAAAALGGCLAPRHERPQVPIPDSYAVEDRGEVAAGEPATTLGWRVFFEDPRLEALVALALERNRDLAIAVARIDEARAQHRIQRSELLPAVSVTGEASRSRPIFPGGASGGTSASPTAIDRYALNATSSAFELDFWGRVRNLTTAARAEYLATVEAERAFRLSLIRDVAAAYLAALEADERIQLAEATVKARQEGLRIAKRRLDAGVTSALDYRQSETLLTQAETELAALRLAQARSGSLLATLVGGPLPEGLPAAVPLSRQSKMAAVAPGLPSALLTERPDVIAAEQRLRAARANIGAARAVYFPTIRLTGAYGYASGELDDLVGSDRRGWTYNGLIDLPIFRFGRGRAEVATAKARESIAIATYQRTVQTAFQEVADALAGRQHLADQVAAQERATQAQRQLAALARTRYREGVVGYLEVLDAERNLFAAEQALLVVQRAELENLVALYVALGGGAIESR